MKSYCCMISQTKQQNCVRTRSAPHHDDAGPTRARAAPNLPAQPWLTTSIISGRSVGSCPGSIDFRVHHIRRAFPAEEGEQPLHGHPFDADAPLHRQRRAVRRRHNQRVVRAAANPPPAVPGQRHPSPRPPDARCQPPRAAPPDPPDGPRARLSRNAPGFICRHSLAVHQPLRLGVAGRCRLRKSAWRITSSIPIITIPIAVGRVRRHIRVIRHHSHVEPVAANMRPHADQSSQPDQPQPAPLDLHADQRPRCAGRICPPPRSHRPA